MKRSVKIQIGIAIFLILFLFYFVLFELPKEIERQNKEYFDSVGNYCSYDLGIVKDVIYQQEYSVCSQAMQFGTIDCEILGGDYKVIIEGFDGYIRERKSSFKEIGDIYRNDIYFLNNKEVEEMKIKYSDRNIQCYKES
jgi:hypothetical protein